MKRSGKSLGLYLHVPFCRSKCEYCAFYSLPEQSVKLQKQYVDAVCRHMEEYGALSKGYTVDTLYLGGGTPSVLGGKRLAQLVQAAKKHFSVSPRAEITVECNPESTNRRLLKRLARTGVNRLSFGVQSTDDALLKELGRPHTAQQAKDAFDLARKRGFTNISVDLMYGLPHQTRQQGIDDLNRLLSWQPEHVSIYGLTPEPGTPMWEKRNTLPDDDEQADWYLDLCRIMAEQGYEHYEISNFSRPGFASRHNSRYWDLSEYLGLGPAGHSFYGGRRFSFAPDLARYLSDEAIVAEAEDCSSDVRHGEYIMLMLRTSRGIEENQFYQLFHREFAPYAEKLRPYLKAGLASHNGSVWRLTEEGFLVSNRILADLLEQEPSQIN